MRFHDGRPLTSRDVVWTIDSMRNGTVISPKAATYASVDSIEAPDARTVIFHLKHPDNFLLTNLSTGAMGIVPEGSGRDFWRHPIGTGPVSLCQPANRPGRRRRAQSAQLDASLPNSIASASPSFPTPSPNRSNSKRAPATWPSIPCPWTPCRVLAQRPNLQVDDSDGTQIQYLAFNLRDPLLQDSRVRQAISCAIDRDLIIKFAHGWLCAPRAEHAAGHSLGLHAAMVRDSTTTPRAPRGFSMRPATLAGPDGVRFHVTMKTSTDEGTRLLAAVLQQQLARVGIALDLRSYEFATFYADVTRGAFQMYSLRWIGGNEQPDIFSYAFSTARFSPKGANRGHYSNPTLDALLDDAAKNPDQSRRRADYVEAQQILAADLPAINLWYRDTVIVHNKRLTHIVPTPSGSYSFLETAAEA